jgi:hypothetical protein
MSRRFQRTASATLRAQGLARPLNQQQRAEFGSVIQSQPLKGEKASDLMQVFPQFRMIGPCGYDSILLSSQAQGDLSASASLPWWYCFEELELAAVVGAECVLYGAVLTLASVGKTPDAVNRPNEAQIGWNPAAGAGNANASQMAAIVIGEKLPVTMAQDSSGSAAAWSTAPSNLPGVDVALPPGFRTRSEARYFHYEYFPVGDFFGASCQRQVTRPIFAPYVHRFPYGRKVQVALVVNPVTFFPVAFLGNDLTVYGHVAVSLLVGLTKNDQSFTNE